MLMTRLVEQHRADAAEALLEVAGDVAELVGREGELLVALAVHEVVAGVVGVQVLDGAQLDLRLDDPVLAP